MSLSCLPSLLVLASAAEGRYCILPNAPHTEDTVVCQDTVDYCGLIPEKGCLYKIGFLFAQAFYY